MSYDYGGRRRYAAYGIITVGVRRQVGRDGRGVRRRDPGALSAARPQRLRDAPAGHHCACLVASPGLIPQRLASPADLATLLSLDLGPARRDHQRQLEGPDGQTATLPHRPRLVTDDTAALRQAALPGVGVVQLTTMMIWREVEQGRLVHALPAWRPTAEIVHAIFPSRRGLLPSVRALLDFLGSECERQRLEADGGTYG